MGVIGEIDWNALGETALFSTVIGIGLTFAFSLAILGFSRFADERRSGNGAVATVSAVVGLVAFAVCIAAMVLGVIVMTSK